MAMGLLEEGADPVISGGINQLEAKEEKPFFFFTRLEKSPQSIFVGKDCG